MLGTGKGRTEGSAIKLTVVKKAQRPQYENAVGDPALAISPEAPDEEVSLARLMYNHHGNSGYFQTYEIILR